MNVQALLKHKLKRSRTKQPCSRDPSTIAEADDFARARVMITAIDRGGKVTEKAFAFTVTGKVQGVGFRYFVHREAHALGLRGWVKNHEDGSVRIQAAGSAHDLGRLQESLRQGPPYARVDHLEAEPLHLDQASRLGPFEITY